MPRTRTATPSGADRRRRSGPGGPRTGLGTDATGGRRVRSTRPATATRTARTARTSGAARASGAAGLARPARRRLVVRGVGTSVGVLRPRWATVALATVCAVTLGLAG